MEAPLRSAPEAFEVEDPSPPRAPRPTRTCLGIFPLQLCLCCPIQVTSIVPGTYQTIQDATHLVLVFGIFANLLILGQTFHSLVLSFPMITCTSFFCVKEVLSILFTLPCTMYFFKVVGQYDERLQAKQTAVKEQRAALTKELVHTIGDMDDLLSRSAESSAGLAEQSFESKRRDFARFLERVQSKYAELSRGPQSADTSGEVVNQFRRFVCNWLKVFEECSIDPVKHPRLVVEREELGKCSSIDEICSLALKRLDLTEIRFISQQREEDSKVMDREKDVAKRMSVLAIEDNGAASQDNARTVTASPGRPRQKPMDAMRKQQGKWDSWQLSWLNFGSQIRCGYQSSDYDPVDGYFPREFQIFCCTFTLLSREHFMLITGFLAAIVILILELKPMTALTGVDHGPNATETETEQKSMSVSGLSVILEVALDLLCLTVLLIRFEEIDVIQQLEREVRDLKKTSDEVEVQHQKMNEFWSNAMELSELWLYRTVPRLDFYKEVHQHVEDSKDPKQLVQYLSGANQRLEDLEANLGPLEQWREGGNFSTEEKKHFMQVMNRVCRTKSPEEQIDLLASNIENKKSLESWSGQRQLNPDAGKAKKIADAPPRDKSKDGLRGMFKRNSKDGMDRSRSPGAKMQEQPSEVPGFLQSNEDAFRKG